MYYEFTILALSNNATMKTTILMILLLTAFQGFGQKKKKTDPKDAKIDSLTTATGALSVQNDSLSKDRKLYYGLYTTLKEKVLLRDFEPAKLGDIIDSLRKNKDAKVSMLTTASSSLRDTLSILNKENDKLMTENISLKSKLDSLSAGSQDKTKMIAELKDLKGLLDSKVITQAEYDAKKKLVMDRWH
jgi:hypothetical protein